eukprot:GEZU01014040.1.p1 GENE.GEZU01014040.1~~GEZU01014040.1.p1  ORF type:complete len:724 (-),score=155.71 GEZU01014040.1:23-2155(-)
MADAPHQRHFGGGGLGDSGDSATSPTVGRQRRSVTVYSTKMPVPKGSPVKYLLPQHSSVAAKSIGAVGFNFALSAVGYSGLGNDATSPVNYSNNSNSNNNKKHNKNISTVSISLPATPTNFGAIITNNNNNNNPAEDNKQSTKLPPLQQRGGGFQAEDQINADPSAAYENYKELKASILAQKKTVVQPQDITESHSPSHMILSMKEQLKQLRNEKDTMLKHFSNKLKQKDLEVDKLRTEVIILRRRLEQIKHEDKTRDTSERANNNTRGGREDNSSDKEYFAKHYNNEEPQTLRWQKGEMLGRGAYGEVFLGMNLDSGELMAVKQIDLRRCMDNADAMETVRAIQKEISVMQNLKHRNIVQYVGTEWNNKHFNIFLEYVPGGSICNLVAEFGNFSESVIRVYARQILLGLEYLHELNVVHRDIKGANILVDHTGNVKLADFGCSKSISDVFTPRDNQGNRSVRGTPYWMAPEVLLGGYHQRESDIWSVGGVLLEMATGKPPYHQFKEQVALLYHIAMSDQPPEIPQSLSEEAKDFLQLCFRRNPRQRPTASALLEHPFVKDAVPRKLFGSEPGLPHLGRRTKDHGKQRRRRQKRQTHHKTDSVDSMGTEGSNDKGDDGEDHDDEYEDGEDDDNDPRSYSSYRNQQQHKIKRTTIIIAVKWLKHIRGVLTRSVNYYEDQAKAYSSSASGGSSSTSPTSAVSLAATAASYEG